MGPSFGGVGSSRRVSALPSNAQFNVPNTANMVGGGTVSGSGAPAANTRLSLIKVMGKGQINWAAGASSAPTGVNLWRLVLDGVEILTRSLAAMGSGGPIFVGTGSYDATNAIAAVAFQPILFDRGFEITCENSNGTVTVFGYANYEVHI